MAVLLALGSALSYGVADFLGGQASRRAPVLSVTALSQAAGMLLLVPGVALLGGVATPAALVWGAVAGLVGAGGLLLYFRALAIGPMSVVAPLAGVVGAAVPIVVGLALGERPRGTAIVGAIVGAVAIWLATRAPIGRERRPPGTSRGPLTSVAAGAAFGLFFVLLDAAPPDSGLWPLVGARGLAAPVLLVAVRVAEQRLPGRRLLGQVLLSGVLDMTANILFLLATRAGLLSLSGLLTSLYPVVVVVLAWWILRERLVATQWVGAALALVAVGLIAV